MTDYGVTSTGFVVKPTQECLSEIEANLQAAFGANIDLSSQSNFGQLAGIFAERESDLWNLAQDVYNAGSPDGAAGAALDNIGAITGCLREPATFSTVELTLTGTPTTTVNADSLAGIPGVTTQFSTNANATIAAATAWVGSTNYSVVGAFVQNGGNIYVVATAGVAAVSGGPTGTGAGIVDGSGSLTWNFVGVGTGLVQVAATATVTGPLVAAAGTVSSILTPVAGWSSVTNLTAGIVGQNVETDSAYRARREAELHAEGGGNLDAIRAKVLALGVSTSPPVTACAIYENTGNVTDGSGRPPNSIECIVTGGAAQDVANAIFQALPAGIQTIGLGTVASETVTDSQGQTHTIEFSIPTAVPIYIVIDVLVNPTAAAGSPAFPADGATEVADALANFGSALGTGINVVAAALGAQAFSVPGVLDTTHVYIGTAPAPGSSATLNMTARQVATFAVSNIAVNVTDGTP